MNKGKACGNSHISSRYQCKKGVSIYPSTFLKSWTKDDIKSKNAGAESIRRGKVIDLISNKLRNGRFKTTVAEIMNDDRKANGKEHAIDALLDAKDPRVGLIGTTNKSGAAIGFMSYKTGSDSLSIQHMGTDQSEQGTGALLFLQLVGEAARQGKGINVASEPDSSAFYEKMGMQGSTGNHSLSIDATKSLYQKIKTS